MKPLKSVTNLWKRMTGEPVPGSGPKSLLGLDIGTFGVKAIELSHIDTDGGDTLAITGYRRLAIEEGTSRAEAASRALEGARSHSRDVATSVSGQAVIVRCTSMQQMPDDRLSDAVRSEAGKYIPFDIDDVILDYHKVPGADDATQLGVLLAAAKRTFIQEHIGVIEGLAMRPFIIDVDCFALNNAFEFNRSQIKDGSVDDCVALLDIGGQKTEIDIIKDGALSFTREIYISGDNFTQAISKRLGVDVATAEQIKRDPGEQAEEVESATSRVQEELAKEIRLSLDYFEHQFDAIVGKVFLSGGGSRLPWLRAGFEDNLAKPVDLWDPTEGIEIDAEKVDLDDLKEDAPQLAVAVGLALRINADQ